MNANGKEQECIDMFRHLEETHPISSIAKQAANLRFIMEAPKLELGEDEKVSVPVLDLDSNKCATACRFVNIDSPIDILIHDHLSDPPKPPLYCAQTESPSDSIVIRACRPRSGRVRQPVRPVGADSTPPKPKTLEEEFWDNYQPPSYARNKYIWAAAAIIGSAAAWYSIQYKDCIPM